MTVNELYVNKKTLNSAHIYFDDPKKAKRFEEALIKNKVGFVTFVWTIGCWQYYGFRMFRMRYQFLEICRQLKEVIST